MALLPGRPFTVEKRPGPGKCPRRRRVRSWKRWQIAPSCGIWIGRPGRSMSCLPHGRVLRILPHARARPTWTRSSSASFSTSTLTLEDEFVRALFTEGQTQMGRMFVQESALPAGGALEVLDYERATEVSRGQRDGISFVLYCQPTRRATWGPACGAPLDI